MESIIQHPSRCKAVIPQILVILWLIFLGAMIWQHAVQSVQPLHHDPLTYMQKAMNFWEAVDQGKLFNPLNIEPTSRPPGTILMSYPFGFSPDFKGFQFRSVFFPVLCIVLAVYMASGAPRNAGERWSLAATAILFSAIPMFYNFDCNESNPGPIHWGLVDNFQAGIAAMAAGGFLRSLKTRLLGWLKWGALLGSLTLLIKPSGLMILAMLAAIWMIVVAAEWLWRRKYQQPDAGLRRYAINGAIWTFLIFFLTVLLCIFSDYLSKKNFAFAGKALKIMENVLKVPASQIFSLLFHSIGIAFLLWIFISSVCIGYYFFGRDDTHSLSSARNVGLLLTTPFIWITGAWYWLVVQAGGNQVRYFYPFFLMGAVCMISTSLQVLQRCRRWIRMVALGLCLLQALNIGLLLAVESPAIQWQRLSGVNVSVGKDREEVEQAYAFVEELRRRNRNADLYSFLSDFLSSTFVTVGIYEGIVKPELPSFKTLHPLDWVNGFSVRIDQFLDVDYILIRKDLARNARRLLFTPQIDTFYAECAVFQAWLYGLKKRDGLKTVSDGTLLRLFEIIDTKTFARTLESFVVEHSWRPAFIAANSRWLSLNNTQASRSMTSEPKEIDFEGVYRIHELLLHQSDKRLTVELCWEEFLHEEANRKWYLFFHLVGQTGNILLDQYLTLDKRSGPLNDRGWRCDFVAFDQPIPKEAKSIAFGIFGSNNEFLLPNKGRRDWEGKRILLPIPPPIKDANPPR